MSSKESFSINNSRDVEPLDDNVDGKGPATVKQYKVSIRNLDAWYGSKQALKNINLDVKANTVTAFIGPSGCGKTTLIRCLNRMHEMTPGAGARGQVILDGINMYNNKTVDRVIIKRRIGMVFQKPNPFPTMSIYDNVGSRAKK